MQAELAQATYDVFLAVQDIIMTHQARIERLETVALVITGWLVAVSILVLWRRGK
jgi:hypothetical protein